MSTREQRQNASQIALAHRWAMEKDPTQATAPARSAFLAKFERQVDPDGVLDDAERARRAKRLLSAHMRQLAIKSRKTRAAAKKTPVGRPGSVVLDGEDFEEAS